MSQTPEENWTSTFTQEEQAALEVAGDSVGDEIKQSVIRGEPNYEEDRRRFAKEMRDAYARAIIIRKADGMRKKLDVPFRILLPRWHATAYAWVLRAANLCLRNGWREEHDHLVKSWDLERA